MAASSLGGNGGRLSGRYRPMSEINVTPLVDVMLVLLIVFMVAAPLLTVGVPVDLPQTQAPAINEPKEPLVITLNREGDRKSTRLNSSHEWISYAVFCLKKKKNASRWKRHDSRASQHNDVLRFTGSTD